jgi:hypothetical protein
MHQVLTIDRNCEKILRCSQGGEFQSRCFAIFYGGAHKFSEM